MVVNWLALHGEASRRDGWPAPGRAGSEGMPGGRLPAGCGISPLPSSRPPRFTLNARTWEGARPLGVFFLANSARYNTPKPDMALRESEMPDLGSRGRREISHQRPGGCAKKTEGALVAGEDRCGGTLG